MPARIALSVALLVLGGGVAWWFVGWHEDQDDRSSMARQTVDSTPGPTLKGFGPRDAAGPREEVKVAVRRLRFGQEMHIRVVDQATGTPVTGANISAFFDVAELPVGTDSPEFFKNRVSGDAGSVLFADLPYGVDLTLRVGALNYVTTERTISVAAERTEAGPETVVIQLVRRLSDLAASTRIGVEWQGRTPVGEYRIIVDDPEGPSGVIDPGQAWVLDTDPAGAEERVLQVRVVGPGFAGEWQEVHARRGHDVSLRVAPPDLSPITFQVVDTAQTPLVGVRVRAWPSSADMFRKDLSTVEAVTGRDGWARMDVVAGEMISVSVEAPDIFFPRAEYVFVPEASGSYMIQGARLVKLRVRLPGLPDRIVQASLEWTSVEMRPSIAMALRGASSIADAALLERHYREGIPREATVARSEQGSLNVTVRLLPGTYRFTIRAGTLASERLEVEIGPEGLETYAPLRDQRRTLVRVVWEGGEPTWPLLHAAVFGHGADWRERFAMMDALGSGWMVDTRLGDFRSLDPKELTRATETLTARLGSLRTQGKELAYDLGFLSSGGSVELEGGVPNLVTIVRGDSSVAVVRAQPAASGGAVVTVGEASFRRVEITIVGASGKPVSATPVFMGLANELHAGRRQLSTHKKTSEAGVTSLGLAPGDVGAVHLLNADVREVRSQPEGLAILESTQDGKHQYVILHGPDTDAPMRLLVVID